MRKLIMGLVVIMGVATAWAQNAGERPQGDTIEVKSEKMRRNIKCVVIVPEQYFDAELQDEQYPVIYLLHGAWGKYSDWPKKVDLDDLASEKSVIFVCPDGQDSWYLDSPIDPAFQFETFISKELPQYVDTHYRTLRKPIFRAITGLSMGGHGALYNAFRHPEVFGSCGSMSGGVNFANFPNRWKLDLRLGKYESNKALWEQHTVMSQLDKLKPGQHIIIDDGTDDLFYNDNNELHKALLERKVNHDYTVRPGNHNWDYWTNAIEYHVLFFSMVFDNAE
ncbi:MAG: esterase family protein [Muribaculaceae bacterium]|nr:esterase family protein [Muribaculaceae bacterium]